MIGLEIRKFWGALRNENLRAFAGLFAGYFIAGLLLYARAGNAQLIDDGFAGLMKFENMGWRGFAQSFGFTSLYYSHDIFVLGLYLLLGKWSFGWFIVMLTLHCVNSVMGFALFRRFYAMLQIKNSTTIALAGSLLFLFSPYQTENVLWAATLHYSVTMLVFCGVAFVLLKGISAGLSIRTIAALAVVYSISLTTLEISLVFPFVWWCLIVAVLIARKDFEGIKKISLRVFLPLLSLIVLYFVATRLIKGHWVPHYGPTHLQNNTLSHYSTSVARYIAKLLSYVHFATYRQRELVYVFCERWKVVLVIQLAFTAVAGLALWLTGKKNAVLAFGALVIMSLMLLFPSLQMYFMYLFVPENDRLGYFFSLGFYQILSLLCVQLFVWPGVILVAVYGVAGMFFLNKNIDKWHDAGVLHTRCIDSFVWTTAPKVYILNSPANYSGVYQFRNNGRLPYALNFYKNYIDSGRIVHVLSSSFGSLNDSTVVTIENDSTLNVKFVTNGGWLMNEFLGATDYSNPEYTVDVNEWEPSYRVVFHTKDTGAVYVACSGNGYYQIKGF